MITKRIIPCLDVKDGRVVKGVNFAGLQDMADPVEMARYYNAAGADELVFYDITASVEGRTIFTDILRRVASGRYIAVVEERHLEQYAQRGYDVLDKIRALDPSVNLSISIGIGRGAKTLREAQDMAVQALDMAQGRGGDQAAVFPDQNRRRITVDSGGIRRFKQDLFIGNKFHGANLAFPNFFLSGREYTLPFRPLQQKRKFFRKKSVETFQNVSMFRLRPPALPGSAAAKLGR